MHRYYALVLAVVCYFKLEGKDSSRHSSWCFNAWLTYGLSELNPLWIPGASIEVSRINWANLFGGHVSYSYYPNYFVQNWGGVGKVALMNRIHQISVGGDFVIANTKKFAFMWGFDFGIRFRNVRVMEANLQFARDYFQPSRYRPRGRAGLYFSCIRRHWKYSLGYGAYMVKVAYVL